MGFKHYGVKTGGLPIDLIKRFVDAHGIEIFIETGTAGGESVRAASPLFKECHTIEIVNDRANVAEYPANVKLHTGDSANLLRSISEPYKGRYVFYWLDAHWSEPGESPNGTNECPVIQEIEAVRDHRAVILIDDARLFHGRPPWPCNPLKGWPSFKELFLKLYECFRDHDITVVDDYILCIPHEMKGTFKTYWYETYPVRFPHEDEKLKQSVRDSFEAFKSYIG